MKLVRLVRSTSTNPAQPSCADCGTTTPLMFGLEPDTHPRRMALCSSCARDLASSILDQLGLGVDAGRMLDLITRSRAYLKLPKPRPVETIETPEGML